LSLLFISQNRWTSFSVGLTRWYSVLCADHSTCHADRKSEIFPPPPNGSSSPLCQSTMSLLPRPLTRPPRPLCRQCQFHLLPRHLNATNSPSNSQSPTSSSVSQSPSPSSTDPFSASRNPRSLSERTAEYIDTLHLRALSAGQKLNDVTGYSNIEALKAKITEQGIQLSSAYNNNPLPHPLLILHSRFRTD